MDAQRRQHAPGRLLGCGVGLLFLSFTLPESLRKSSSGVVPAAVSDRQSGGLGLVLGILALTLIALALALVLRRAAASRNITLGLLLALPAIVHGVMSLGRGEASSGITALILILVLLAMSLVIEGDDAWQSPAIALALIVVPSLVFGIFVHRLSLPTRYFLGFLYPGRLFGFAGAPNGMGMVSALCVVLSLSLPRKYGKVYFILGVVGLLASGSQTAIVAAVLGLMTYWVMSSPARPYVFVRVLTAMSALAVALVAFQTHVHVKIDWTFSGRRQIWSALLADSGGPLGLGSRSLATLIANDTRVGSTHDVWIDSWLRDGVPGVVAAVVLFLSVGCYVLRRHSAAGGAALMFLAVEGITEGVVLHITFLPLIALVLIANLRPPRAEAVDELGRRGSAGKAERGDQGVKGSLRGTRNGGGVGEMSNG